MTYVRALLAVTFSVALIVAFSGIAIAQGQTPSHGEHQQPMQQNRGVSPSLGVNQQDNVTQDPNRGVNQNNETGDSTRTGQVRQPTRGAESTLDEELPATAGEIPFLALIGVLSLIAAGGMRILTAFKS